MKFLVVFALAAACAHAQRDAAVVRFDSDVRPDGFSYAYETSNGISENAAGVVSNPNSENAALSVNGAYSYTADDGTPISVSYVADENGFQPQGNHLPTSPPIPEAIARALAYLAAHPPAEDKFQAAAPARVSAPAPFPAPARKPTFGSFGSQSAFKPQQPFKRF